MRGRLIDVRSVTEAESRAWRSLAERAVEPNPLYEAECVIPAATHQEFGHDIALAVAEEGEHFYACVPVRHVKRWHKLPYPIVTSQVRRMIYSGTPLVDPDRGIDAFGAVLDALVDARRHAGSRVFALQEITAGGPVDAFVRAAAEERRVRRIEFESWDRAMVVRRPNGEYDDTSSPGDGFVFGPKQRVRKARRLARDLGDEPKLVDYRGDPDAVDRYIELEASGYKSGIGVALTTVAGETEFFKEMCERFAAQGRLHLLALEAAGQTLAMNVWIRAGDGVFMIKWSFDEKYAKGSPGLLLHAAARDYFHRGTDARWLDTCTYKGNDVMTSLFPDRRHIASHFFVLTSRPQRFIDESVMRAFVGLRPLHRRLYERLHPDERFSRRPRNVSTHPSSTTPREPS